MRRAFTLAEVMIVIVVILILGTIGIAGYSQVLDNASQRVCGVNQLCISKALDTFFLEEGVSPATLGELKTDHLYRAYTEVMEDADWQTRLAYAIIRLTSPREACADINELKDFVDINEMAKYGIRAEVLRCPAKRGEGVSYGINSGLKSYSRWKNVPEDTVVVADCDNTTFAAEEYNYRHMGKLGLQKVAQGVTKGKKKVKKWKDRFLQ